VEQVMTQSELIMQSERLGFRLLEKRDLEDLKRLDQDPEVRAFFPDGVLSAEQIKERILTSRASFAESGFSDFAVVERDTGQFAGRAGFALTEWGDVEVGYVFLKEYWGRGFAQEALSVLLDWAKQNIRVPRIIAYAPTAHRASLNVMKKCGMRYVKSDTARDLVCDFYEFPL
jgi:RimJ/RimL family protein N-acetyltransferase